MSFEFPKRGYVFWPVGNGDSTSIVVADEVVMQVDVNQTEAATDADDPREPVVDGLIEHLPRRAGRPYLAAFALSHPDEDHCRGFAQLNNKVQVGELWFTPRIFREYRKDLCDDALAFRDEAMRRVRKTIRTRGAVASGDRVRVIGFDDLLKDPEFAGFPPHLLSVPGSDVTTIDGTDHAQTFRAFIHSPFKEDADGERNDTSMGMQVALIDTSGSCSALLLGDLSYAVVMAIFKRSQRHDVAWNVLLAPHHCSKSVMYTRGPDGKDHLQDDVMAALEDASIPDGYIVSSSQPVPASNREGDDPPHAKAKHRYEEVVEKGHFVCTQEHPNATSPVPVVFEFSDGVLRKLPPEIETQQSYRRPLPHAINQARGEDRPPSQRVGFGRRRD